MKPKLSVLMFVPGMLFWVLVAAGAITHNDVMIGVAVGIAVVTIITVITLKVRSSSAERAERLRIWSDGKEAKARVITLGGKGGALNDHPYVDLELEVTVEGEKPYRATVSALISQLAIPRIQPDCVIAVRVDRADAGKVVVDSALTPYGYK